MKQSNVNFTKFDGKILPRVKKVGNIANNGAEITDFGDNESIASVINSLEIDWNGAIVSGQELNTTGEVLSMLQTAYNFSKTTFKTINGNSIVGTGNITISAGTNYTLPNAGTSSKPVYVTGNTPTVVTSIDNSLISKSAGTSTLSWNTEVTLATIAGQAIKAKLPVNPNTDTKVTSVDNHYKPTTSPAKTTSGLYKLTIDAAGHITGVANVNSDDIVNLISDYLNANYQKIKDVQISIPTSIVRTKSSTVTSISKSGGSFTPTTIKVGGTSAITGPSSVTVTYSLNNTTDNITISGADAVNQTPIINSSNTSVIEVNGLTLKAKTAGKSIITVVCNGVTKEQEVSVSNATNTSTITSGWTYSLGNSSIATITDTQIEGKSVGQTAINVAYGGKTVSLGTLTVESAATYYWYVGQENPANLDESFNPEGVEGWTKLDSTPTSIKIFKETPDWSEVQWYLACPSQYGFDTSVNGVKVGGWDITRNAVEIGGVKYDVWKAKSLTDTVNTTLAKV